MNTAPPAWLAQEMGDVAPPAAAAPPVAQGAPVVPTADIPGLAAAAAAMRPQAPPQTRSPLTAAFLSGGLTFHQKQRVPVKLADGSIGEVDAPDVQGVIESGGDIVTGDDVHRARMEEKYGGFAGGIGAFAAGGARGLSAGLSDPVALGLAGAFGGAEAKASLRERLNAYDDLHPYATGAGEIAGMVAPGLLTGGASAFAEGAEAANGVNRAVEGAGRIGSGLVKGMVGEGGESLVARALRETAMHGTEGAIQGALYGAGSAVSEASLGDTDLTGEKLLASIGHGALLGGLIGGAVGAIGEGVSTGASAARAKASPIMRAQAETQAWKAASPISKYTKEAEQRAGGVRAVGRTVLDAKMSNGESVFTGGAMTPEDLFPRVADALDVKGEQLGAIMDQSGATISGADIMRAVDKEISAYKGIAGFEDIESSLNDYRNKLGKRLGILDSEGEALPRAPNFGEAPKAPKLPAPPSRATLEKEYDAAFKKGGGKIPTDVDKFDKFHEQRTGWVDASLESSKADHAEAVEALMAPHREKVAAFEGKRAATQAAYDEAKARGIQVPVGDLFKQRRGLDKLAYKESKALDPKLRVEGLRAIRGALSDLEVSAIDGETKLGSLRSKWTGDATGHGTGVTGEELRRLRKEFQQMTIYNDALKESSSKYATNRNFSLSDNIHAAGVMASGHPLAAVGMLVGHKLGREGGNAILAAKLDKLSVLSSLERRSASVTGDINRSVDGFFAKAQKGEDYRPRAVRNAPTSRHEGQTPRDEYEQRARELSVVKADRARLADHVDTVAAQFATHAPRSVAALTEAAQRAAIFLSSKLPKDQSPPDVVSLAPRIPKPTDQQVGTFLRYARAVDDPASVVEDLRAGRISREGIEALRTVYPKVYEEVRAKAMASVQTAIAKGNELPFKARVDLGLALDIPTDWSVTPDGLKMLQANAQPPAGGNGKGKGKPQGGPAPKRPMSDSPADQMQSASDRRMGGQIR